MRRRLTALIAVGVLSAGLVSAGSASASPCGMETVQLNTFHIVMQPNKTKYHVGEWVNFELLVTRPGHEDPLGQGQQIDPPQEFPAADIQVGVGVAIGDVFLYGFGLTDENGEAEVRIKLKPYTPRGETAFAVAVAQNRQVETVCANVDEFSILRMPNAFKTLKK